MTDRAESIYLNAKRYSKASRSLNLSSQDDQDLLFPSFVNAALALELFFKALFYIENNTDFKIKNKNSHDFSILFDRLNQQTKKVINQNFNERIKARNMEEIEVIEREQLIVIPRDLRNNLKLWSEVFVSIRYIYDRPQKPMPMMFFPEIEQSVLLAIYHYKPEWKI